MVIDLFGPGGSLLTFFQCYRWTPKPDLRSPSFLLIPKYHKYTCFESIKIFSNFLIVLLYFYVYLAKFSSRSIGGKDFLHYFCKICVSMSPLSMITLWATYSKSSGKQGRYTTGGHEARVWANHLPHHSE